jgi:hypothetical protein
VCVDDTTRHGEAQPDAATPFVEGREGGRLGGRVGLDVIGIRDGDPGRGRAVVRMEL